MLATFIAALGLGFIFNAVPGAIFAETVRQGVRGGFKPALAVQVGSLAGDALWAVLGLIGIGLLLQVDALRLPVGVAGAVYLGWLAWDAWRAANQEFSVRLDGAGARQATRSGVLLSVTNPQNIAYWAALGGALGAVGIGDPQPGRLRDLLRRLHDRIARLVVPLRGDGRSTVPRHRREVAAHHVSGVRHRISGARAFVGA